MASINLGREFSKKNKIDNVKFVNADIFDDVFNDQTFNFIWTNGVLHHTKNPSLAFDIISKYLKKNGYILVGLYNRYGRLRPVFRKFLYKSFGEFVVKFLDPSIKNLKKGNEQQIKSWIRDQYEHPVESLHTLDEVLGWFNKNNIEYINSIPSCNFGDRNDLELFQKTKNGTFLSRLFSQISMLFNYLGSDGGLFIVIEKMIKRFLDTEFLLVKFPIFFPVLYGLILFTAPEFETYLIFFTILILAETHFGATWPFFLNKSNQSFIKENRVSLISIPLLISIFSLIGFVLFKATFLLIFFAANMYHVTRQSFGVCKLYTNEKFEIRFQEIFIYFFNFLFFLIGFFRFYFPLIPQNNLQELNLLIIISMFLILLFYFFKFKNSEGIYTFFTGLIIFYPICFVSNPVHAIIMGVTMHYTQYLYLTFKVYKGRKKNQTINTSKLTYLWTIVFYSTAMSFLSLLGKSSNEILNFLIIIPIIGQMLHFYLDSQLWKFSNPHNRVNVLNYIKN